MTLHVPPGSPETEGATIHKPHVRVFFLGARAESSLPPHIWEQLALLFPSTVFHLFFIGPQVSLPKSMDSMHVNNQSARSQVERETEDLHSEIKDAVQKPKPSPSILQSNYILNIYMPPTPAPIPVQKRARSSVELYGVPSYTVPYTSQLTITGIQAPYRSVHAQFSDTLDPYTDCFFFFSPWFGFPSTSTRSTTSGEPILQISSSTEWGGTLPLLLQTKCAIFITRFSPADLESDIRSLSTAEGVAGEFDWIITPGENVFGSEK
jgi:mitochondrial splicing suppressor protein 51